MLKFKKLDFKIATPFFLLFAIFLVTIFYKFNRLGNQDLRSLASEEDDANYCVKAPDCCSAISKTHDAHECDWPIRGYCNNCGDIEGKNERCGWYWIWHDKSDSPDKNIGTNMPAGYGCMIGDSPGSMRPKYNADGSVNTLKPTSIPVTPTQIPQPTSLPVPTSIQILPTEVPPTNPPVSTQIPEQPLPRPQITYVPIIIPPYTPPTLTPTPTPFKINLPNILPAKEKVQSFLEGIRLNLLDFFSKILP